MANIIKNASRMAAKSYYLTDKIIFMLFLLFFFIDFISFLFFFWGGGEGVIK